MPSLSEHDLNRVEFYSKEDMVAGYQLEKAEPLCCPKLVA
jgi:hypothetical protein